MSMIEEAVDESTQWAVFEPHDFNLRQSLILSISSFLGTIWRQGGLVGTTPEEAFFIKCDETNNPPAVVDRGKLIADIGVAPTHPAEFIVFRVGRTVEELEIVER
jgi:phage tail sheath protein FI